MGRQSIVYIILGIAVLIFLVTLIKDWRPSSKKKKKEEDKATDKEVAQAPPIFTHSKNGREIILPLCLQAYERLVLFMERIRLDTLIKRLYKPGLNVRETERLFIDSIRSEFEHNVSQQIYVSSASWEAVSSAKEQLIRFVHIAAAEFSPSDNGQLLRKKLLTQLQEQESPVSIALEILNTESKKLIERNNRL